MGFKCNIEIILRLILLTLFPYQGKYLALGSQAGDITVYIGAELCANVTLLSSHIICKPPARSPAAGDFLGNNKHKGLPYVIVSNSI